MADKRTCVRSVIKEIFEKDIRRRVKVKNVSVFNQVRDYIINNFGTTTSLSNILSDLERQGVRVKRETLNRYLQILEDAKVISKCTRFDMGPEDELRLRTGGNDHHERPRDRGPRVPPARTDTGQLAKVRHHAQ